MENLLLLQEVINLLCALFLYIMWSLENIYKSYNSLALKLSILSLSRVKFVITYCSVHNVILLQIMCQFCLFPFKFCFTVDFMLLLLLFGFSILLSHTLQPVIAFVFPISSRARNGILFLVAVPMLTTGFLLGFGVFFMTLSS